MQLPHRLVVITPTEIVDGYDNPVPRLDYGPTAPRRAVWAHVQPLASDESAEPGRSSVVTRWRAFTRVPVDARERVEWHGLMFEVDGAPAQWSPRFGHSHHELVLRHVQG